MAKRHRQVVGMNMSKELKKELLGKLLGRYARRNREGKSRLLDELCEDYKYDRKYAIKLLGGGLPLRDGRAHFWTTDFPKSSVGFPRNRLFNGEMQDKTDAQLLREYA